MKKSMKMIGLIVLASFSQSAFAGTCTESERHYTVIGGSALAVGGAGVVLAGERDAGSIAARLREGMTSPVEGDRYLRVLRQEALANEPNSAHARKVIELFDAGPEAIRKARLKSGLVGVVGAVTAITGFVVAGNALSENDCIGEESPSHRSIADEIAKGRSMPSMESREAIHPAAASELH